MNPDRFTVKTQEALQSALSLAAQRRNPQASPEHLLLALLDQEGSVAAGVLRKLGADETAIRAALQRSIDGLPTLGQGGEASQVSSEIVQVFQRAENEMRDLGDSVVTVEHVLLALAEQQTPAADALRAAGATKERLVQAIREVRGPHAATDPNAEDQYQALEKFGNDLTQRAREGKLDPVIGRDDEIRRTVNEAIEALPDSVPFWLNKAVMEHEEGKAKQACRSAMDLVEISQHTLTESPHVDQGRQMIAAFEATGAFPNARGYLGWLGLGCASMKAGRAEDALEFFDRVINAASGNANGFRWKGRALTQLGQMDEALILFDAALEVDPNDPEIHHDRGIALGMLGDTDRAVEAFDAALALDPHHKASLLEKRKYTG